MRGSISAFEREERYMMKISDQRELYKYSNTFLSKGELTIFNEGRFDVVVPFIPGMPPVT